MKIFTATFFDGNYGSALQAFALQAKLKELGVKPVIVEKPKAQSEKRINILQRIKSFLKPTKNYGIIQKTRLHIENKIYRKKKRKIQTFVSNNIITDSFDNCCRDIESAVDNCILLTGSDQVWNIINGPINDFYLFRFVKNKKIRKVSYAASIGLSELNNEEKEYYARALSDYHAVSFREKIALDLLGNYLNNPIVRCDLDPTLLFNKDFWLKITGDRIIKERYIFVYILQTVDKVPDESPGFSYV